MSILDSKFYSVLDTVTFFLLLNILWICMCLPVITIFPATAAMFAVMRQYVMNKDTGIFIPFFRFFKENFRQSMILSVFYIVFIIVLYLNWGLIGSINLNMYIPLLVSLFLLGIIVSFTTVYIFPMMVHYKLPLKGVLKNSFLFSLRYFPSTILCIIFAALMILLLVRFPITSLAVFSFISYFVFVICFHRFRKLEELTSAIIEKQE